MNDIITRELIQKLQAQCPDVNVIQMANQILKEPGVHHPAALLQHKAQTTQALKMLTRDAVKRFSGQPDPQPEPQCESQHESQSGPFRKILDEAPWLKKEQA